MRFIENVKGFYNGITFLKRALLDARVEKDEKKEKEIISEMESYLFHLKQFLGTILERKGNIVDLGEVWHTLDLKSKPDVAIAYLDIVATVDNEILREVTTLNSLYNWLRYNSVVEGQVKWAFWRDLLPKGGNK